MSRNNQRNSTPSRVSTTMKQTRSVSHARGSPYSSKPNHGRLRDSDVSHQQKRKPNTPSMAQPTTGGVHVNATKNGVDVSACDGANTDDDDDSAEAEIEEDGKEPIAVAPPDNPSIPKDSRAGLSKDQARTRSATAWKKDKLTGSEGAKMDTSSGEKSKPRRTPAADAKRRGIKRISVGIAENSDEDDYDAVDLISNSEEEEPEVEELEEKMIIDSEEENEAIMHSPELSMGPPSISSGGWEGFDLDDGVFLSDVPFFDEQISRDDPNLFNEVAIYNAATSLDGFDSQSIEPEATTTATPRRVRFEEEVRRYSDSTSTDGSDDEENGFPDLFMQQDSLDPNFRLMIENDNDEDDGHSLTDGENSYWDLKDQEELELERHGLNGENNSSSCGSSSGYETDEGDTTDEDLPPPSTITRPRCILRRASTSSFGTEGDEIPQTFHRPATVPPSRRYGPSMGSWIADPNKPIAVIDCTGKRMVIYPARNPSKRDANVFGQAASTDSSIAATSPRTSFVGLVGRMDDSDNDRSDFSSQECGGPMLSAGANLIMPGLFHGTLGSEFLLGGQVLGPPEAFYPFKSVGADGNVIEDDEDDEDEDDENLWNVHDFIDFGDGSSDSDELTVNNTEVPPSPSTPTVANPASTPAKPDPASASKSTAQELLDHFDRGVVTAFRRNQHRHQALLRRPQHREFMGSGPASAKAGSAIKGGRAIAANSPISPLRKRKASFNLDRRASPLTGVPATRKLVSGHKRRKSSF